MSVRGRHGEILPFIIISGVAEVTFQDIAQEILFSMGKVVVGVQSSYYIHAALTLPSEATFNG